jgi:UDP-2,4-diacetamido-2,4,6-trideoxy-beta-L-altropyranose hydrolase
MLFSFMDQKHIAFLAESHQAIGTGHVFETLFLAEKCSAFGLIPHIWLTDETPHSLKDRVSGNLQIVDSFGCVKLAILKSQFQRLNIQAIVTNFRSVNQEQIDILKDSGIPVICIDELGQRFINPHIIINNSIVPEFHAYPNSSSQIYAGPAYMCMDQAFEGNKERTSQYVRRILISMGGTDRSRATLRVIEAFLGWNERSVDVDIVVGPGFDFLSRIEYLLASAPNTYRLHVSPRSLTELIALADVGITAGGNTLYEMACQGTPAIVLFEDEHERLQGKAFESFGFGACIGCGADFMFDNFHQSLDNLENPQVWIEQSLQGQILVDGKGASRILNIICERIGNIK